MGVSSQIINLQESPPPPIYLIFRYSTWTRQFIHTHPSIKPPIHSPIGGGLSWRFMICDDTPTYGWAYGWLGGYMGRYMSNDKISNKLGVGVSPEDLWFVMIPLPMGGFMGDWVGTWVGSCQISKNWIHCDLIEIIQLCLNIYDMWWHPTYGWVYVKIYFHQFQQTWYQSNSPVKGWGGLSKKS